MIGIGNERGLARLAAQIARDSYTASPRRATSGRAGQKIAQGQGGTAHQSEQQAQMAEAHQQADLVASAAAAVGAALEQKVEPLVHEARISAVEGATSVGGSVEERLAA